MYKKTFIFILVIFIFCCVSCSEKKDDDIKFDKMDSKQKFYYAMGNVDASQFVEYYKDFDIDSYVAGIKAFQDGTVLDETAIRSIVSDYENQLYGKNLKTAEEILEKNKKEDGVVTLDSGLQYKVLRQGDGQKPVDTDTVEVNYKLTLPDGTVADSSYDRGQSSSFPLSGVVKGFAEGVMQMNVGSMYRIWVHPDLGYGKNGAGSIEPNTLLIFDVELLSIK